MADVKVDDSVKSRETPIFVIPVEAGIQLYKMSLAGLDSGFHRSDDFLRDRLFSLKGFGVSERLRTWADNRSQACQTRILLLVSTAD